MPLLVLSLTRFLMLHLSRIDLAFRRCQDFLVRAEVFKSVAPQITKCKLTGLLRKRLAKPTDSSITPRACLKSKVFGALPIQDRSQKVNDEFYVGIGINPSANLNIHRDVYCRGLPRTEFRNVLAICPHLGIAYVRMADSIGEQMHDDAAIHIPNWEWSIICNAKERGNCVLGVE